MPVRTAKNPLLNPPPEYRGRKKNANPLRYTVLHHTGIADPHFDLLIETDHRARLTTWRIPHWPITRACTVEKLPNHRRRYLDYQGPLSRTRGTVKQIQTGTFTLARAKDAWLLHWDNTQTLHLTPLSDSSFRARPGKRNTRRTLTPPTSNNR